MRFRTFVIGVFTLFVIAASAVTGNAAGCVEIKGDREFLAFSPDSKLIVTAPEYENTANIREAATGKILHTLQHEKEVNCAAFSSDGKKIVTGSYDDTAVIWNVETGQKEQTIKDSHSIDYAEFSPNGKLLLTNSYDLKIWSTEQGIELKNLGEVRYAKPKFSTDGKMIFVNDMRWGHPDGICRIMDIASGKIIYPDEKDKGKTFLISPDGKKVYKEENLYGSWNPKTGKLLRELTEEESSNLYYKAIRNKPNNRDVKRGCVVSAGQIDIFLDSKPWRIISCRDRTDNKLLFNSITQPGHWRYCTGAGNNGEKDEYKFYKYDLFHLTESGDLYAVAHYEQNDKRQYCIIITGQDKAAKEIPLNVDDNAYSLYCALSPDSNYLAFVTERSGMFQIFDLKTNKYICKIAGNFVDDFRVRISPDSKKFVVDEYGNNSHCFQIWDIESAGKAMEVKAKQQNDAENLLLEGLK